VIRRAEPRTIPDKPIYIRTEIPHKGIHYFRVPGPVVGFEIFREMSEDALAVLFALRTSEVQPIALYFHVRDQAADLLGLLGAVLGVSWHHETLDLETTRSPEGGASLITYGGGILEYPQCWLDMYGYV